MTILGEDITNLDIYTLNRGEKLGIIHELIYDPEDQLIKGFLVNTGQLLDREKAILYPDVLSIGENAVIVDNEGDLREVSDLSENLRDIVENGAGLAAIKVITESGRQLGYVRDLFFDSKTGRVEGFQVSQGALQNLRSGLKRINVSDIITVGQDAIIVKSYTEEAVEEQAERGGLMGQFNKIEEKAPQVLNQAKQKAQEVLHITQEKAEEIQKSPRVQSAYHSIRKGAKKTTRTIEKKAKQLRKKI